ncbi:LOW QUALITY PROTEIN: vitelline membrane outer layer protein 1 homolog [Suncus etruscus]|uniref:LOW QUALITY PROTEIN: vitelline membrane outer layer protein 1 homolog n=1 Tax=Suncus etruscus TaxID=109475 RepID=UPI0021104C32|nr:LOW QUALITY PROTEIN: vitelline membrane outer layer protein 1 homolog [Suncus etruscus]
MEWILGAKLLLLLLWATCCESAEVKSKAKEKKYDPTIIEVNNGGPWGDWAWPDMCPDGFFAGGFSLKVEPSKGITGDDTALNGIRLHCTKGNAERNTRVVESQWGAWSEPQWCPGSSFLVAFSLRVDNATTLDSTAANNVRFRCSDGTEVEGPGLSWGTYGNWSNSCVKGLCGLQTKIQSPMGLLDDTALNDVFFFCCKS